MCLPTSGTGKPERKEMLNLKQNIMKTKHLVPIIIGIITGTLVSSCERSSNKKVEDSIQNVENSSRIPEPVPTDRTTVVTPAPQTDEDIKEFRDEANRKIKENEEAIADLKRQARKEKKEVREKYEKETSRLEEKNRTLKERMANYKKETKHDWQSFKREFNHDMDEIGKSLKDLTKDNVK